jgi:hypothetical protein
MVYIHPREVEKSFSTEGRCIERDIEGSLPVGIVFGMIINVQGRGNIKSG